MKINKKFRFLLLSIPLIVPVSFIVSCSNNSNANTSDKNDGSNSNGNTSGDDNSSGNDSTNIKDTLIQTKKPSKIISTLNKQDFNFHEGQSLNNLLCSFDFQFINNQNNLEFISSSFNNVFMQINLPEKANLFFDLNDTNFSENALLNWTLIDSNNVFLLDKNVLKNIVHTNNTNGISVMLKCVISEKNKVSQEYTISANFKSQKIVQPPEIDISKFKEGGITNNGLTTSSYLELINFLDFNKQKDLTTINDNNLNQQIHLIKEYEQLNLSIVSGDTSKGTITLKISGIYNTNSIHDEQIEISGFDNLRFSSNLKLLSLELNEDEYLTDYQTRIDVINWDNQKTLKYIKRIDLIDNSNNNIYTFYNNELSTLELSFSNTSNLNINELLVEKITLTYKFNEYVNNQWISKISNILNISNNIFLNKVFLNLPSINNILNFMINNLITIDNSGIQNTFPSLLNVKLIENESFLPLKINIEKERIFKEKYFNNKGNFIMKSISKSFNDLNGIFNLGVELKNDYYDFYDNISTKSFILNMKNTQSLNELINNIEYNSGFLTSTALTNIEKDIKNNQNLLNIISNIVEGKEIELNLSDINFKEQIFLTNKNEIPLFYGDLSTLNSLKNKGVNFKILENVYNDLLINTDTKIFNNMFVLESWIINDFSQFVYKINNNSYNFILKFNSILQLNGGDIIIPSELTFKFIK